MPVERNSRSLFTPLSALPNGVPKDKPRGVGREDPTGTPNAHHIKLPTKARPQQFRERTEALKAAAQAFIDSLSAPRPAASEHIQLLNTLAERLAHVPQGVSTLHTLHVIHLIMCHTLRSMGLTDALYYLLRVPPNGEVRIIDDDQGVPHEQPSDNFLSLRLHPHMLALVLDTWTARDALSGSGKAAVMSKKSGGRDRMLQTPLTFHYLHSIVAHERDFESTVPSVLQSQVSRDAFGRAFLQPSAEILWVSMSVLHWCLSGRKVPLEFNVIQDPPSYGQPFKQRPHTHMHSLLEHGFGRHLYNATKSLISILKASEGPVCIPSDNRRAASLVFLQWVFYPVFKDATHEYADNQVLFQLSGDECDRTEWPPALIQAYADLVALDLTLNDWAWRIHDHGLALRMLISQICPLCSTQHAARLLLKVPEFFTRFAKDLSNTSPVKFFGVAWRFEIEVIKNLISAADPASRARICAFLDREQVPYSLLLALANWTLVQSSSPGDSTKRGSDAASCTSDVEIEKIWKEQHELIQGSEIQQQAVKAGQLALGFSTLVIQGARGSESYSATQSSAVCQITLPSKSTAW